MSSPGSRLNSTPKQSRPPLPLGAGGVNVSDETTGGKNRKRALKMPLRSPSLEQKAGGSAGYQILYGGGSPKIAHPQPKKL